MKRPAFLLLLIPLALLGLAIRAYNQPEVKPSPIDEAPPANAKPDKGNAPVEPDSKLPLIPVPSVDPATNASKFLLPDGSYALALNGVTGAKPLKWPPTKAWSPIEGKVRGPNGEEWYVHEDGSMSTTVWSVDHVRGVRMPLTRLALPNAPADVAPPKKN